MRKVISVVVGLVMGTMVTAVSAAIVESPFTIKVEATSEVVESVDVGSQFNGIVRYDDTDLTPDGAGFLVGSTLEIDFAFSRGSNFTPPELVIDSAKVSANGELLDLRFSVDFPNDLFFSAENLAFKYQFSELVDDGEGNEVQEIIASGRGIFLPRVTEVAAPATGLLLLPLIAILARRRRQPCR